MTPCIESVPSETPAEPVQNCLCEVDDSDRSITSVPAVVGTRRLLIDLDNTLNDWDAHFYRCMDAMTGAPFPRLRPHERTHYEMERNFPVELRAQIQRVTELDGFWREMPLRPHAREAVLGFLAAGVDVLFVTRPDAVFHARSCKEKVLWAERQFGPGFNRRVVPVWNKQCVCGDFLIDDNPYLAEETAHLKPNWGVVTFCQPYNRHVAGRRLHSWTQWRSVLALFSHCC